MTFYIKSWSSQNPKTGASRLVPFSHLPDLGESVIGGIIGPVETEAARSLAAPGLRDPASHEALRSLTTDIWSQEITGFLEEADRAEEGTLTAWLDEARDMNYATSQRQVIIPSLVMPVGVALLDGRNGGSTAWALRIALDPVMLAFRQGRADLVAHMCTRLYKKPDTGFERLRERSERQPVLCLQRFQITDETPFGTAHLLERGWSFDDWDQIFCALIRLELDWRVQGPVQEIPVPGRVLPALAVGAMTRGHQDREAVRKAIASAEAGRLITGEGISPMLDEVLKGERRAQTGPINESFAKTASEPEAPEEISSEPE